MQRVHRLNPSCTKTSVGGHEVRNRFAKQPRVTARSTSKDSESVGLAGVGSKSAPTPPAHSAAPNDTYTTSVTNSLEILHYDPQVNSLDDTLPMTIEASVSDVPEAGEPYDALGGPPSVLETHPFKKQSRIKTVKAKSELACARLDTHIGASGATKNLGVKGRLNKRPEAWRENNLALIQVIQSDTQILGERLRQTYETTYETRTVEPESSAIVNVAFVRSLGGILKLCEIIISCIVLICVASAYTWSYHSSGGWVNFVAAFTLILAGLFFYHATHFFRVRT
ncbi:hypothetical protein AHF37_08694 [Paragonimus kellicotti]|nr:hypothetical protein AHF37_08694 [Paragonimus kellicotti]